MANINNAIFLAKNLCRQFEGFCSRPYICPAGVVTIALGATFYENGVKVSLNDPPMSREQGEKLLEWHLNNIYLPAVLKLCPVQMHDGELAALIDFCFNLGAGNLKASTMRRYILAGDWDKVPGELRKWVKGGGKTLPGLVRRREAEIQLL